MLQEQTIPVLAAVVEAPFTFLEVKQEEVAAHPAQLEEAKFGKAPKGFDTVDGHLASIGGPSAPTN